MNINDKYLTTLFLTRGRRYARIGKKHVKEHLNKLDIHKSLEPAEIHLIHTGL